jgi:predicted transcriptional regulator of viral defense system
MPRSTIKSRILAVLAEQRRVVAADWRFHVVYMRVAHEHSYRLPDVYLVNSLIRKLTGSGDLALIEDVRGVYRVTVPYASTLTTADEVIVQEANPAAVFSNFTAVAYHDLTDEIPSAIYATRYTGTDKRLPLDTSPNDWVDVRRAAKRTPETVNGRSVKWTRTKPEWDFGDTIGYAQGLPVYVTDLERTVLDSLRFPEKSGGSLEVLRIWKRAAERLNVDVVVDYVERFGQSLLRQRVGFIMEQLGLGNPRFDDWAKRSVRGSSAKLVASRDFSPTFSERWNLSINVPESLILGLQDQ